MATTADERISRVRVGYAIHVPVHVSNAIIRCITLYRIDASFNVVLNVVPNGYSLVVFSFHYNT